MHYWVASSAGLQHEKLELVGRVSELSGRVSALQQEAAAREALRQMRPLPRSVDSLQPAPKPELQVAPQLQAAPTCRPQVDAMSCLILSDPSNAPPDN